MIQTRPYHGFQIAISRFNSNKICYILLPKGLKEDGMTWMEEAAEEFRCNIIVISGMDWNNDLTPWPAKGIFKKEKNFGGKASAFLKDLTEEYLDNIESSIGVASAERALVGISLSGLFAIWAGTQTDKFNGIASISGSLWYDDFTSRFASMSVNPSVQKFFISLGQKEKKSKEPRMSTVEDATNEIVRILKEKGVPVDYVLDPGTHFSPIVPRLQEAFSSLYSL